ncbi:MAG: CtsR family transcriptional regulator [Firmicutes bacterium]|nr:CtsR family transcriptional regulator [Bacillota bacterium]
MKISEVIERFIKQMLMFAEGETIDIQRNELANQLGCAPSQINYVIKTRFTNEHGYIVESRRGGGGFIRITKMQLKQTDYLLHIIDGIGERITARQAAEFIKGCAENEIITKREFRLFTAAVSDSVISVNQPKKDKLRANILKNMLMSL